MNIEFLEEGLFETILVILKICDDLEELEEGEQSFRLVSVQIIGESRISGPLLGVGPLRIPELSALILELSLVKRVDLDEGLASEVDQSGDK